MSLLPILQADLRQLSTIVIPKRFRYHWDKRPQNKHRVKLLQVTLPRFKDNRFKFEPNEVETYETENPYRPMKKKDELNLHGLDVLLYNEVSEIFNTSPMICACLRTDMPTMDMFYKVQYELRQHDMDILIYPSHVIMFTIKDTPYDAMKPLFDQNCAILFGKPNCKRMLSILKPNPYLLLLGGLVDGKYMSKNEIESYSKLPNLDESRAKLCSQLTSLSSSTYELLRAPSAGLASSLGELAKGMPENKK
uniref:Large ribosomal subunit protein uL10m n=1 Tax=Phallusia mammillata TaxID=59560 RepID=A0A6F9DHP0_9ASCI|nr:uncharacterized protein LOC100178933 [Phallusia mammillata]